MRITLAYPIAGVGQPDEIVEVDDETGRTLLGDGYARLPAPDAPARPAHRHTRKPPADGTPEHKEAD